MAAQLEEFAPIARSVNLYRRLLALYPAGFRQEYEGLMLQLFRDCCLGAYRQNGAAGMARLWAVTFLDLVQSLLKEHLKKETNMSNSTFIRISGWALVLAGVAFFLIFPLFYVGEANPILHNLSVHVLTPLYYFAFYAGPLLLLMGMLGLRARYGEAVGAAGSFMLLFGAVAGPALSLAGILGSINNDSDSLMVLTFYGPTLSMLFLAVFGVFALGSKPLSRFNGLPLLAGIVLPVIMGLGVFVSGYLDSNPPLFLSLLAIQFLAMVALGIILQGDVPGEKALAA